MTLITVLVFFERSYVVPHSYKVSLLGLNWFRIYDIGRPLTPPNYLMSKNPRLVRVKQEAEISFILVDDSYLPTDRDLEYHK